MLPEGWKRVVVRELGEVQAGRQRAPSFTNGHQTPYLRVANVFDGRIDTSDVNKMPFTVEEFGRYKLELGDILLNEGQSLELVGRPAMYQGLPENCCFQNTLIRFRPSSRVNPDFALKRFQQCLYDGTFQSIAKQTTSIAHLGVSRFADLELLWPPLDEQKKIAEVIDIWNESVAVAEKLLANSRQQKQVLMQQLLTGKRRLQKFVISHARLTTRFGSIPADWRHVPIEQIACEFSAKNVADRQLPVLSCTKYGGLVDSLSYFNKQVFSQDVSTYKLVERGCFAYATNHIDEGSIGYQNLYDAALISPMYTVFKPGNDIDHGFLFKLLKTEHYRQIFAANTNASVDRRGSLRWGDFKKIEIPLPSMAEQAAISSIIDSAQLEVESSKRQLEKLKDEKRALMQQLLTGKRRVRLPATEAASA